MKSARSTCSLAFAIESRGVVAASAVFMLLGGAAATFIGVRWQPPAATANSVAGMLDPRISGVRAFMTVLDLNSRTAFVIACGFLTCGISSALALMFATAQSTLQITSMASRAIPTQLVAASVLPHAPVECVAFCLIGAAGLSGAPVLVWACKGRFDAARSAASRAGKLAVVGYLFLVLAAAVEAFVTPWVMTLSLR